MEHSPTISQIINVLINSDDLDAIKKAAQDLAQKKIKKEKTLKEEISNSFSKAPNNIKKHLYNLGFIFRFCGYIEWSFRTILQCFFEAYNIEKLRSSEEKKILISQFVDSSWKFIGPADLKIFLKGFKKKRKNLKNEDKLEYVGMRLRKERFSEAVQAIRFLKLYLEFDRVKISESIKRNSEMNGQKLDFSVLSQLINEEHPKIDDTPFINFLINFAGKENNKACCEIIKKFNLNFKEYPNMIAENQPKIPIPEKEANPKKNEKKLNENLPQTHEKNIQTNKNQKNEKEEVKNQAKPKKDKEKDQAKIAEENERASIQGFLRYQLKKKQWFLLEEMCSCSDELLAQLALAFFRAKKEFPNFAIYIVEKYGILNKNVTIKEELQKKMLKKDKTINSALIFNPLYQNDSFGPLEENIALSPPKSFLNLSDFGILESDVFFISNTEDSNFVFAKESIENSDLIGMDAVFTYSIAGQIKCTLSIIQIATLKNVFIFDVNKLPGFQIFFSGILMNDKITKVAQSMLFLAKKLKKYYPSLFQIIDRPVSAVVMMNNLYDAAKQNDKSKKIEMILGKPRTTDEKSSNWEKRPLRKSQLHFAALEAVIPLVIVKELSNNQKINLSDFRQNIKLQDIDDQMKHRHSNKPKEKKNIPFEEKKEENLDIENQKIQSNSLQSNEIMPHIEKSANPEKKQQRKERKKAKKQQANQIKQGNKAENGEKFEQKYINELPLEVNKDFSFGIEQEKLRILLDQLLQFHEKHIILINDDLKSLCVAVFGILNKFLDYYYISGALVKIDETVKDLKNIPIKNKVCLIQLHLMTNLKKDFEKMFKQLKMVSVDAKKENMKGILVNEDGWYLLRYEKNSDKLSVTKPLKFLDIDNGKVKLTEDYIEFFEIVISFLKK